MSSAFVRESEDQWLEDIAPTMHALVNFLTRENNGIRVYEVNNFVDQHGLEVFNMSNGLLYSKTKGKWEIINEQEKK